MSAERIRYQDVFVPGGFPRHTYNPRAELGLEEKIAEVKDNLCKLVTVTGQTKAGKTVLVRKILPPETSIWIDGGAIGSEDDFWQMVVEQLGLYQTEGQESSTAVTAELAAKGSAGANFVVAKGEAELGGSLAQERGEGGRSERTVSSKVAALGGLRGSRIPLVIDDFHYLSRDLQGDLVRALKPAVFDGVPVVVIAIPHRRYDAVKVEREMAGRISAITIPPWAEPELTFIPTTGFGLLDYDISAEAARNLALEAIGSPHLMQDFCRGICKKLGIQANGSRRLLVLNPSTREEILRDVADTIGRPIFEKLARGPRQRADRIKRQLKDGRQVDIYQLILHALAKLRPGIVSLEYEDLRGAIRDVSGSGLPQLHEVSRVLKHMATIAASDQSSTPVIDFEEAEKKLHITDPFFAFYLRWGDLSA